jgi:hypothetical protein
LGVNDTIGVNVPRGDWTGSRKPTNNYSLSGVTENLSGPSPQPVNLTATALSNSQKKTLKKLWINIEMNWPSQEHNPQLAEQLDRAFVDPAGFWSAILQSEFLKFLDWLTNRPPAEHSHKVCL